MTLFSGLDLGPGTYYLVLAGFPQTPTNDQGDWHLPAGGSAATTVTFGPGVTTPGWFAANTILFGVDPNYAPASTFRNDSDPFFGIVTGPLIEVAADVPEPSTLSMFFVAFLAVASLHAQRSARRRRTVAL